MSDMTDREKRLKDEAILSLEYAVAMLRGGTGKTPSLNRWNDARRYALSAYEAVLIGRAVCEMRIDQS